MFPRSYITDPMFTWSYAPEAHGGWQDVESSMHVLVVQLVVPGSHGVCMFLRLQPRAIPRVCTVSVRAPTCVPAREATEVLHVTKT